MCYCLLGVSCEKRSNTAWSYHMLRPVYVSCEWRDIKPSMFISCVTPCLMYHVRNKIIHSLLMSCVTSCYVCGVRKESTPCSCHVSRPVMCVMWEMNPQLARVMCYALFGESVRNETSQTLLMSCGTYCLVCHVRNEIIHSLIVSSVTGWSAWFMNHCTITQTTQIQSESSQD